MKLSKIFLPAAACLALGLAASYSLCADAQVTTGKLPRKVILGAVQSALADSAGTALKPFVCKPATYSVSVRVTGDSLAVPNPYTVTADSLGITLEVFKGDAHVFNRFFRYRASNFDHLKAKVNSALLKRAKLHGDSAAATPVTVLSISTTGAPTFRLTDNCGRKDFEGDAPGIITLITSQIPGFDSIVAKDYVTLLDPVSAE